MTQPRRQSPAPPLARNVDSPTWSRLLPKQGGTGSPAEPIGDKPSRYPEKAHLTRECSPGSGCEAETLDDTRARATETLAGRARTTNIVDANVVEGDLRRGDLIVSSDQGDLAAVAAAVGRHIDIGRP